MLRRGGRGGERRRREKNRRVGRGIREKRRGGWGEETLFSFSPTPPYPPVRASLLITKRQTWRWAPGSSLSLNT